jgi:hypothetical protein
MSPKRANKKASPRGKGGEVELLSDLLTYGKRFTNMIYYLKGDMPRVPP